MLALAGACSAHARPSPSPTLEPAVTVENAADAKRALGKRVRFEGRAANAKLSAVVIRKGMMIYCLDRSEWPSGLTNASVAVEGTLERTEEFMAQRSPTEPIRAGTAGPVWVMRACRVDARAPVD
jgi:hypothetical protein